MPAVSKQDDIFELQVINLKIQFLSWFKQALNVGFIICIVRTLTQVLKVHSDHSSRKQVQGPAGSQEVQNMPVSPSLASEFMEIFTHLQQMNKHPSPITDA